MATISFRNNPDLLGRCLSSDALCQKLDEGLLLLWSELGHPNHGYHIAKFIMGMPAPPLPDPSNGEIGPKKKVHPVAELGAGHKC
jgi:hypothetical protein